MKVENAKLKEEAKDIHSIKNGEGEYVLGQMYPPGSVGVKNMIDALEFYMEAYADNQKMKERIKEQQQIIGDLANQEHIDDCKADAKQDGIDELTEEVQELRTRIEKVVARLSSFKPASLHWSGMEAAYVDELTDILNGCDEE